MDQSNSLTAEGAFPIAKVARRSAAEDVRQQLISLIESGTLKVDERLPSEHELARDFGVSRPVIREALVGLTALGLATAHNGRGTFVASDRIRAPLLLGRYSPAHLNEVRRYLEVPSARLAAERRSDEDIGRLAGILARLEDAADPAQRNKLDADFHIAMAQAGGNPLLVKLVEDLRALLEAHSLAAAAAPNRRAVAIAEHRAIFDAILRRDAEAAGAAMAAHLDAADNSFIVLARTAGQETSSDRVVKREITGNPRFDSSARRG